MTDKEDLLRKLEKIRKQGYATDNMEHEEGVRCVVGPTSDYHGEVIVSLSISDPAFRMDYKDILIISETIKNTVNLFQKKSVLKIKPIKRRIYNV